MAEIYNSLDSVWLTFKEVDPRSQLTAHTLLYKRREHGNLFIEEDCWSFGENFAQTFHTIYQNKF